MAYSFSSGDRSYLSADTVPVSSVPFTMSAQIYPTQIAQGIIIAFTSTANTDRYNIAMISNGEFVCSSIVNNVASQSITTGRSMSINTWYHVAGVYSSVTNRQAWLNGISATANTTSSSPVVNRMQIGARLIPSINSVFIGRIANVGIWNVSLTSAEIVSLSKGVSCNMIRPQNLIFHAPLIRDLIDTNRGLTLTNNNTATIADHPRIYI